MSSETLRDDIALPVGSIGASASGWWGAWLLMLSETAIFAYLFFSYFYFSVQPSAHWVPGGPPPFTYTGPQTGVVLIGCVTVWFADWSMRRDRTGLCLLGLGLTWLMCSAFIALEFVDWFSKPFSLNTSTYSSIYFVISGAHLAHVVVAWFMYPVLMLWTLLGYFDRVRHVPISIGKLYWYFVTGIWIAVFFVLNCTPYFF